MSPVLTIVDSYLDIRRAMAPRAVAAL